MKWFPTLLLFFFIVNLIYFEIYNFNSKNPNKETKENTKRKDKKERKESILRRGTRRKERKEQAMTAIAMNMDVIV